MIQPTGDILQSTQHPQVPLDIIETLPKPQAYFGEMGQVLSQVEGDVILDTRGPRVRILEYQTWWPPTTIPQVKNARCLGLNMYPLGR
jgi:hypothetical protein